MANPVFELLEQSAPARAIPRQIESVRGGMPGKGPHLPPAIREFIGNIKDMSTDDKIAHVHDFVIANMDYSYGEAAREAVSLHVDTDFAKVMKQNWSGDCDNFATTEAGLLKLAGVPAENICFVGGHLDYVQDNGKNQSANHAVCMVRGDNNSVYMLDTELQNPVYMNSGPNGYIVGAGQMKMDNDAFPGADVTVGIKPNMAFSMSPNTREAYLYPENVQEQVLRLQQAAPPEAPRPSSPNAAPGLNPSFSN